MKLLQWFLFAVCLGVSSIVLRWLTSSLSRAPVSPLELFDDGELLVVAVAIAGAALSDIAAARTKDNLRQLATFTAVICVMLAASLYSLIQSETYRLKDDRDDAALISKDIENIEKSRKNKVVTVSFELFAAAVLVGGTAIAMKD